MCVQSAALRNGGSSTWNRHMPARMQLSAREQTQTGKCMLVGRQRYPGTLLPDSDWPQSVGIPTWKFEFQLGVLLMSGRKNGLNVKTTTLISDNAAKIDGKGWEKLLLDTMGQKGLPWRQRWHPRAVYVRGTAGLSSAHSANATLRISTSQSCLLHVVSLLMYLVFSINSSHSSHHRRKTSLHDWSWATRCAKSRRDDPG